MKKYFRKGNAFFGFVNFGRDKDSQFGVHPVWGRIFILFCTLLAVGWVVLAFAGFLFLKHNRDIESGRYLDLLLFRWDEYKAAWGEDYIETGQELIEDGEFREGFHYVRVGLIRAPHHIEGRLLLANIYLAQGETDRATRLLVQGMPYGIEDTDYVTTAMRVLLRAEKDEEIREVATEFLPDEPVMEDRYVIIAFATARASFHRGDFDRAVSIIEDYQLASHNTGRILLARIDWQRGHHSRAIERLEELVAADPEHNEAYIYLTRYHHELGDIDTAEHYAVVRQLNDPLNATPRIDLLYIYRDKGETERLNEEIDALLREFRGDMETLELLAQFALDTTDVALAERIFEHAQLRNLDLSIPGIVLVHTLLKADEYERATSLADRLTREVDGFEDRFESQILAVNAIADYARGNRADGDLQMNSFLSSQNLRPSNYITYSDKLIELGMPEPARRILARAHRDNPRSQSLLNALIRIDITRNDGPALIANLPKLMDMRLPSREVLEEAYRFLSSDRFLFTDNRMEILEALESTLRRDTAVTIG